MRALPPGAAQRGGRGPQPARRRRQVLGRRARRTVAARRRRPDPGPPVGDGAARAGDGRGGDRGAGRERRRLGSWRRSPPPAAPSRPADRPVPVRCAGSSASSVAAAGASRPTAARSLARARRRRCGLASPRHRRRSPMSPRWSRRVDRALRGVPGVRGARSADPAAAAGHRAHARSDAAAAPAPARGRPRRGRVTIAPAGLEDLNAALIRCKDAVWAVAGRPGAHGARGRRRSRGPTRSRPCPPSRRSPPCRSRCRRSTASRSAAATPPGCTCSSAATDSTCPTPRLARAARRRAGDDLVHVRRGAHPRRPALVRVQSRGGDRRAGRQHRGVARGDQRPTSCSTAPSSRTRPRSSCSVTRVGRASASSPRPTPTR